MIGSKVSQMILDNKQLSFYKYDSDVKELLGNVRDSINEVCPFVTSMTLHVLPAHFPMLVYACTTCHSNPASMLCLLWPC